MKNPVSGMFRSLRNFNFRLWASGALLSNIGTWMQRVAQDWLVLTQLTHHDAAVVGTVIGLQFAPFILLLPWTGLAADRFNQRRLLMLSGDSPDTQCSNQFGENSPNRKKGLSERVESNQRGKSSGGYEPKSDQGFPWGRPAGESATRRGRAFALHSSLCHHRDRVVRGIYRRPSRSAPVELSRVLCNGDRTPVQALAAMIGKH